MQVKIDWRRKFILIPIAIIILAVVGPFGTSEALSPINRIGYWTAAVVGVGAFMNLAVYSALTAPFLTHVSPSLRLTIGLIFGSFPGTSIVYVIEAAYRIGFGNVHLPFLQVYFAVLLIGLLVGIIDFSSYAFGEDETEAEGEAPANRPSGHSFQRRIKPELGRNLVSITMQDHYLEVVTDIGRDLLLMRMGDAMRELAGFPGVQVHRSHWVANASMEKLVREGSSHFLILTDARRIPVSRTYLPEARNAIKARQAEG